MSGVMHKVYKGAVWSSDTIDDDAESDPFSMEDFNGLYVETVHDGTLDGSVVLQGCNTVGGTFQTLTDASGNDIVVATPAGGDASFQQTVSNVYAPFVRFAYENDSGSGTLAITVTRVRLT